MPGGNGLLMWRMVFGTAIALTLLRLLLQGLNGDFYFLKDGARRYKRWILSEDLHTYNVTHVYHLNSWYRYAQMLADLNNVSDCYVCSLMPISASHPRLTAIQFPYAQSSCIGEGTSGENDSYVNAYMTMHDDGTNTTYEPCAVTHPLKFIKTSEALTPFATVRPKTRFPLCFYRNGSVPVGSLPLYRCNQTVVPMKLCMRQGQKRSRTVEQGGDDCPWPNPRNRTMCRCWGDSTMPNCNGTATLDGIYWMCGHRIYLNLPLDWGGICAPVRLTDHTSIITQTDQHRRSRREIDVKPHDPFWGTDVPDEHKLWTTSYKVALSLFPWTGVGKLLLRVETQEYRIGLFYNASIKIFEKQSSEISAMRLMVMQNRLVLDLMAAAKGGVCAMLNDTCCTYIPDNMNSHDVTEALHQMRNVQGAMIADTVNQQEWDLFKWFRSGTWLEIILKICTPIIAVLIMFCVFATCVIPCFRCLIAKTVHSSMNVMLLQDEVTKLLAEDLSEM